MRKSKADEPAPNIATPIKPLPNQRPLPFDHDDEARRQAALFDDGRDLPGAEERGQQILWDLPAVC